MAWPGWNSVTEERGVEILYHAGKFEERACRREKARTAARPDRTRLPAGRLQIIHKDQMSNARTVQRFLREARAAAQLHHPNIVVAHDAEEAAGELTRRLPFRVLLGGPRLDSCQTGCRGLTARC